MVKETLNSRTIFDNLFHFTQKQKEDISLKSIDVITAKKPLLKIVFKKYLNLERRCGKASGFIEIA